VRLATGATRVEAPGLSGSDIKMTAANEISAYLNYLTLSGAPFNRGFLRSVLALVVANLPGFRCKTLPLEVSTPQ
jgi:hypothetical protein